MKFRYLGDHEVMQVYGYDFSGGATPDVTDARAVAKFTGNREFELVEEPADCDGLESLDADGDYKVTRKELIEYLKPLAESGAIQVKPWKLQTLSRAALITIWEAVNGDPTEC